MPARVQPEVHAEDMDVAAANRNRRGVGGRLRVAARNYNPHAESPGAVEAVRVVELIKSETISDRGGQHSAAVVLELDRDAGNAALPEVQVSVAVLIVEHDPADRRPEEKDVALQVRDARVVLNHLGERVAVQQDADLLQVP